MNNLDDIDLINRIKEGDTDSLDILIRKYMGLIRSQVRKSFLVGGDEEDLLQEGLLALINAVKLYDPSKNKSFSSYVTLCVHSRIIDTIRKATRGKHKILNDAFSLFDDETSFNPITTIDPLNNYLEKEKLQNFYKKLNIILNPLQNKLLKLYFEGYTYSEISDKLNISTKKVDNTLNTIKNKLKRERKNFLSF